MQLKAPLNQEGEMVTKFSFSVGRDGFLLVLSRMRYIWIFNLLLKNRLRDDSY